MTEEPKKEAHYDWSEAKRILAEILEMVNFLEEVDEQPPLSPPLVDPAWLPAYALKDVRSQFAKAMGFAMLRSRKLALGKEARKAGITHDMIEKLMGPPVLEDIAGKQVEDKDDN